MRFRVAVCALVLVGCKGTERPRPTPVKPDPHSHAQPDRVAVRHLSLDLTVDFAKQTLAGSAALTVVRNDRAAKEVVLDTNGLVISSITDCATKQPLHYELGPVNKLIAQALTVTLPEHGDCVAIAYRTGPDAGALLWVDPAGTAGKQKPMLFTQSQAIFARTWIPLQDTPGVRFTYDATIHVPPGLWALMSAENPQTLQPDGVWRFRMDQPIPSYLMALAVGDLAFRKIGPRTGVYAEPSMVDAAAREFVDVDAMMAAAEKLYGPYRWGRYDMLVLPPSFPYGGMENPRLTFLTPTVITGDRALVSLIAHELAHSWSGNLVTNSTWNDVWLNEGFTTYVERRIMEELRGRAVADVLWSIGRKDLETSLDERGRTNPDTRMALDWGPERDLEDAPSDLAYEKGALFLRTIEQAVGRETFDAFLRRRFDRRAFQSSDTLAFETEANAELFAGHPQLAAKVDVASWLHAPGLPADAAASSSAHADMLARLAGELARTGAPIATDGWQTLDWVVFLRSLPPGISADRLAMLDDAFHLTASTNDEIAMHWLPLLVRADVRTAAPTVEAFLTHVGRRRMVRPIYEAMVATNDYWRALAGTTFDRARPLYHPITRDTIAKLLGK
jgi:leukotriene-A4 hydrolase